MSRPLIGLDMLYYAPLLTDTSGGTSYDTPLRLENIVSLSVTPNTEISTFFADDGPREAFSQIGEVDVSLQLPDIASEDYAFLIGANYNIGTGQMTYATNAIAPEVAIGFRAQKSDGSYRYIWLMKGKFGVANMEHQTKESGVNFQTMTLNGKFLSRTYDNMVFRRIDENDPNFAFSGLPTSWFADPDLGVVVTADPPVVDSFVGIAATATWVFDKGVNLAYANTGYFKVYDETTGAFVADADIAVSVGTDSVTNDEVTLTFDAALDPGNYVANVQAGFTAADGGRLVVPIYRAFTVA